MPRRSLEKSTPNFVASKQLKDAWAATIQEVLKELAPQALGKSPQLNLKKAYLSNSTKKGDVRIPITGQKRFWGLLKRQVTGHVRIKVDGCRAEGLRTRIEIWSRNSCLISVAEQAPTREKMKQRLLADSNPLKKPEAA